MGNFFIKKDIKQAEFVNKVMFYLWSEVCKDEYQTQKTSLELQQKKNSCLAIFSRQMLHNY